MKVNGIARKRPGTGRKLPTIPPVATSPAGSEGGTAKESPKTSKSDLTINGTGVTPCQRGVKISSHVLARYEDTETESISPTKTESGSESVRDNDKSSTLSMASIDTEVLLKDTQTVMAAMEQRVGSRSKQDQDKSLNNGHMPFIIGSDINDELRESINLNESASLDASVDLDSDTSSTVALVNGDEDFIKPSYFKSPRESLTRAKLKLKSESLPSKPVIDMGGASSGRSRKSIEEGKSVVSDVFSDVNGDSTVRTNASEASTEAPQFVRQSSKGKGQMSMTRPNRAFQLRRAKADDETETPKSASTLSLSSTRFSSNRSAGSLSNISKTATTQQKPRRPMSGNFTPKQIDSARSQNSLGAQIVQKSRENQRENFQRADGGRHSLRVTRSMTVPNQTASTTSTSSSRSRQSNTTPSSSNLKHSSSLRITGVSAKERSSSVTRTKTESPRSAERNAWKRRKEYDPRRAVAEAKTQSKETSRRKREIDLYNQRQVTRSASFTNTRDLNLKLSAYSQNDSVSSADDLSRRSSATSDVFDDHSPKRGFVPYSGRSIISSNVSCSVDEYEVEIHSRSSSTQVGICNFTECSVAVFLASIGQILSVCCQRWWISELFNRVVGDKIGK